MSRCGKCEGKGWIKAFLHIQDGVCFECNGTGDVSHDKLKNYEVDTGLTRLAELINSSGLESGSFEIEANATIRVAGHRLPVREFLARNLAQTLASAGFHGKIDKDCRYIRLHA